MGLLLFYKEKSEENENMKNYKIAVAGTGYVGLSLSVLLAQHNQVMAVDIVQAKVDMINNHKSPIQDDYIEKYLAEKELNLTATLDAKTACIKKIDCKFRWTPKTSYNFRKERSSCRACHEIEF